MPHLPHPLPFGSQSKPTPRKPSMFAEVVLGSDAVIVASDEGAADLFQGLLSSGKPLAQALDEAQKSGVLVGDATTALIGALERHQQQLLETRDGRTLMMTSIADVSGNHVLRFVDVTIVVETALSKQRDALTGLPNRIELLRSMKEHLDSSSGQSQGALLFLDLDRFKLVNDTLGHPIGDALLKLVTERVSRIMGAKDLFARVGGDEFVILQRDPDQPRAAEALAHRLIDLVGRTYLIQGHSVQVGVSVGIALPGLDGATAEDVIKNADLALFKAKSGGRSTFRFFTEAMDLEMQRRRALEIDLQRALVLEQFHLVYQPQFQIGGNRLVGFEALLRWSTPERGNVSPADFIPIVEEIGLMDRLGEWVLRRACEDAANWPGALSVSVNVSPIQFKDPRFMGTVLSALAHSGLSPVRLDVEITEGALMDDTNATISVLTQLKALGIKISMDDFGTGYSSLSYLQKFPFDKIKIDQSFIRSMETSEDSASIVRAVTALGASLGMTTIAEGVETENQLARITQDGCNQVQGYLTGRPIPAHEAKTLAHMRSEELNA